MTKIQRWQFIAALTALLDRCFVAERGDAALASDDVDDVEAALTAMCREHAEKVAAPDGGTGA